MIPVLQRKNLPLVSQVLFSPIESWMFGLEHCHSE